MLTIKVIVPPVVFLATIFAALPASLAQEPAACNLIQGGDFSIGIKAGPGGDFGSSTVPHWTTAFGSPQVTAGPGCEGDPGFVSMWGNGGVGEGIRQTLATKIQKGHRYRLRACVRYVSNPNLPPYVRFNVRASQGPLGSYAPPVPTPPSSQVGIIGDPSNTPSIAAPGLASTDWTYVTVADWIAPDNYDTITINPENNSMANAGSKVSWGQIDRICLQDTRNPCPGPNPDFTLTATLAGNAQYYTLNASAAPVPKGAGYYWRVEEIDQGGQVINKLENPQAWWANPLATNFSGYCCQDAASPAGKFEQGHRYRIVRGVWSTCHGWSEVRKTVFMCNNCRARDLQIETSRTDGSGADASSKAALLASPAGPPTQPRNAEPAIRPAVK